MCFSPYRWFKAQILNIQFWSILSYFILFIVRCATCVLHRLWNDPGITLVVGEVIQDCCMSYQSIVCWRIYFWFKPTVCSNDQIEDDEVKFLRNEVGGYRQKSSSQRRPFLNAIVNFWKPQKKGNFLTPWVSIGCLYSLLNEIRYCSRKSLFNFQVLPSWNAYCEFVFCQCFLYELLVGGESESEKDVADMGTDIKLLVEGFKQHFFWNHVAPSFWQFPESAGITWRMLVVLVVISVNRLLWSPLLFDICWYWLSSCREYVNSAALVSRMFVYLLCVTCKLIVTVCMLLVLVRTYWSVVGIEVWLSVNRAFSRENH